MRKELSAAGNPDRWERAELEVARPSALMLSVRIPAQLAIELESYAAARSLTISDVARHAIEQFIRGIALVPSYAMLGTTGESSLKLAGPTVLVHAFTVGTRSMWEELPDDSGTVTGIQSH
jgi:hypothetical protein